MVSPPRPASPASEEESGEAEGGSLGEMMRCLVLLQRWGMLTPEDTADTETSGVSVVQNDVTARSQQQRLTLSSGAEAGVCARLRLGSLAVQDVLNQLLDCEIPRAQRTLHAVD